MKIVLVLKPFGGCIILAEPGNNLIAEIGPQGKLKLCYVYEPWVHDPELYPWKEEAEG